MQTCKARLKKSGLLARASSQTRWERGCRCSSGVRQPTLGWVQERATFLEEMAMGPGQENLAMAMEGLNERQALQQKRILFRPLLDFYLGRLEPQPAPTLEPDCVLASSHDQGWHPSEAIQGSPDDAETN